MKKILLLVIILTCILPECSLKKDSEQYSQQIDISEDTDSLFLLIHHAAIIAKNLNIGNDVQSSKNLDSLLNHLTKRFLKSDKNLVVDDPTIVDSIIKIIYIENSITFDPDQFLIENTLPQLVMYQKKGSCLGTSFLFLLIAERFGIPMFGVYVPGHFFVRYLSNGIHRNIEPNRSGFFHPDSYYHSKYLSKDSASYMLRNLSRKESAAVLFYNIGSIYLGKNFIQQALFCFRQSTMLMPVFAEAWGNLAICLARIGMSDSARIAFNNAYRNNPKLSNLLENIGNFEVSHKNFIKAIQVYTEALQSDSGNATLRYDIGFAFYSMNELDSALKILQPISSTDINAPVSMLIKLIKTRRK